MPEQPRVFISHTTRDGRDHALAHQLADGLRQKGADVWIAPDNLPSGSEWQEEIVDAVLRRCTHFLVIISAASVRAHWVLEEIRLAKDRKAADLLFTVLPLVAGSVEPYANSDFIDKFQRVPFHADFPGQFSAVLSALHLRPSLPTHFAELTEGFVGRKYVFNAIDEFLASDGGYFELVGDPGEGKSSILAEFVRRTGSVSHFNVRAEGINTVGECFDSLCSQIVARTGLVAEQACGGTGYGSRWKNLLRHATAHGETKGRLVLVIDALDEVAMDDHTPGANILFLPKYLEKGVFVIMSRRRKDLPLVTQQPINTLDLIDHRAESLDDIRTYLRQAAARPALESWIATRGFDKAHFVDVLADKSECNFMYLHYVLPEIATGAYRDLDFQRLPRGLKAYYEDHWQRMGMRSNPVPRDKILVIYVMAAIRQPVSRQLIARFSGQDPVIVQEIIDDWRQFLHEEVRDNVARYSIYHASFLDFLHDKEVVKAHGQTFESVHQRIARELK
jgi:hypothetical protein